MRRGSLMLKIKRANEGRLAMDTHRNQKRIMGRDCRGFSLIELLIVVFIILILASMAIPSYLGARARANEASAVSSIRVIIGAQTLCRNSTGHYASLADLSGDYLDKSIASGNKSGFYFDSAPENGNEKFAFTATAIPTVFIGRSATGRQSYFADESNIIRMIPSDTGDAPDPDSPPLH
jgi:prepilin-type N-terminal cleavage/methylation domain-containing protein